MSNIGLVVHLDTHTHTHTHRGPIALPGPLKWSVANRHDDDDDDDNDISRFAVAKVLSTSRPVADTIGVRWVRGLRTNLAPPITV